MTVLRPVLVACVVLLAVAACPTSDEAEPGPPEGSSPGDCTDALDNDTDGDYDCWDAGCAGSPDCVRPDDDDAIFDDDDGGADDDAADDDDAVLECVPDDSEENDTSETATALSPGSLEDRTSCPDDLDWYTFEAAGADDVTIVAPHDAAEGNVDLRLLDGAGVELRTGTYVDGAETLELRTQSEGSFFLEVFLAGDEGAVPGNTYDLELVVTPSGFDPCVEDALEENDSLATATPLTLETLVPAQACELDDDWYSFTVAEGTQILFDLQFLHAEGNLDLFLHDVDGNLVNDAASLNDNEVLNEYFNRAGTFHLRVALTTDAGTALGNAYTLETSFL